MTKRRQAIQVRRPCSRALLTAAAASLLLGSTIPAFAKKGGGGNSGGGGGGEEPPPPPSGELPLSSPTAIDYVAKFFDPLNPDDWAEASMPTWLNDPEAELDLYDVNRDGIAVGSIFLPGQGTGYAIVATPSEGVRLLDSVFAPSLATASLDGFRIRRSTEINANGWIACSLVHAEEPGDWIGVGNIGDGDSLRILDGPLTRTVGPLVGDLNEAGDVIATESILTGRRDPNLEFNNWLHIATPGFNNDLDYNEPGVLLAEVNASSIQINTTPLQVAYSNYRDPDLAVYKWDLLTNVTTAFRGENRGPVNIDETGDVYTFIRTQSANRRKGIEEQGYPVRWSAASGMQPLGGINSANEWFEVIDASAGIPDEGDSIEILMGRGVGNYSQLEIFCPDVYPGTRSPVAVVGGEVGLWESLVVNEAGGISRPGATGHGFICGQGYDGTVFTRRLGFILIPLTP